MGRLDLLRTGGISLCVLLLASILLILVASSASYPMFHYDLHRTGNVSGDAPMTNDLLWSTNLGGFVGSSPIVSDGNVYVSNWEMNVGSYGLHCLDERTGAIIWNNPLDGGDGTASTAALFGDRIVVGSKNGYVYCINASSGETIWNKRIEHSPTYWGVASSPIVYDNKVFITTFSNDVLNNGTLHVFDFDGSELWNISTGDTAYYTSPAIAEGNVFFAGHLTNHSLFCVNISTHNILWQSNTNTQIKSTPAIWNNTVFFASEDRMYAVDVRTGDAVWNNPFSCVMSSPAVSNGKVYIGSDDKKMYCYDGITGEELWNCTVDGVIQSSPVIAHDTVFFGTSVFGAVGDGTVYALNTTDGSLRWSYNVGLCVMSSPAVADGILFIGADDGSVYAFGENPAITTNIRIEGKNETIWSGEVTFSNATIVDTDNVSHYLDKPTALGAVDAASKLGNFSYEVENQTYGLFLKSIDGEAYDPATWDGWMYRVDYHSPMIGAADFMLGVTEPPSAPHTEVLWYYGSWTDDPLKITLDKTSVTASEAFNATVTYYNDTASGWEPLANATVHVGILNYTTGSDGNATLSLSSAGTYSVYAEKEGCIRSPKRDVSVFIPRINVRIEGKNETIWSGEVTFSNSTIVDTDNVSHYLDKPTALGAVDAASKLGNFSYEVEDMGWGLLVTSIGGEAYNPVTWDPSWLYRVDYIQAEVGAADFVLGVTEQPSPPHEEVLWNLGSFLSAPLKITLEKTSVNVNEHFSATVESFNDTSSLWSPVENATVHVGISTYTTGSDGNATISLSSIGTYSVYAEKEGCIRSPKRNVSVSQPIINVRIEGKNKTIWYGEVTVCNSTIVDTANVSHYFDNPTALGALDAASKLGNFSYKVVDMGWGLMVTSIGEEVYNPVTWDPSWLYRVDYYSPMVGAADFILNVTEPPSTPHEEVLWYLSSFTAAPLTITLDKTSVKVNEHFTATVESYNDTSGLCDLVDNATVYVDGSNYTTDLNGSAVIAMSNEGTCTIYAEKEGYVRSEKKSVTVTPGGDGGGGGDEPSYWWSGSVTLPSGTFTKTAFDTGKEYTINWQTALGALQKASEAGGFAFEIEETTWGPFVYSIADKKKYDEGATSGWMYQVNGASPMVGAHEYSVATGDEIIWYFSKSMDTTPSTSSRVLKMKIESVGGDPGGHDSSPSSTPTSAPKVKKIEPIEAGENVSVTFEAMNVTRIIINANNTISNVEVAIAQLEEPPNTTNVSGILYCYFNVTATNLTDNDIANATIEFRVNKTWINENNIDEATITLSRYSDNNWSALPTAKINEDNTSLYFEAITPGFSLFAISGERETAPLSASAAYAPATRSSVRAAESTPAPATTPAASTPPSALIPRIREIILTSVGIASLLIVLVAYLTRKRGKEREK